MELVKVAFNWDEATVAEAIVQGLSTAVAASLSWTRRRWIALIPYVAISYLQIWFRYCSLQPGKPKPSLLTPIPACMPIVCRRATISAYLTIAVGARGLHVFRDIKR